MAPDLLLAPTIMLPVAVVLFELAATACYLRAVAASPRHASRGQPAKPS